MVTVDFYQFSKKRNSTKRPTGTALASLSCALKEPCGVVSPEIYVTVGDTVPGTANYAYIGTFNRYYYITEWTWREGAWVASLKVDTLATYKTQIGSSSQYVTRAQSAYNTKVIDDVIPTQAKSSVRLSYFAVNVGGSRYSMSDPFPASQISSGRYVVGIINQDNNAVGACSYYQFDDTNFKKFKAIMMDVQNYSGDTAQQDILRAQFNPINYIASVKWFPNEIPRENTGLSSIPFGWWTLSGTFTCYRITGQPYTIQSDNGIAYLYNYGQSTTDNYTVGIPQHPQISTKHSNVQNDKYCKYTLECHPFGIFPLPAEVVANTSYLSLHISVDPISGDGTMRLKALPYSAESGESTPAVAIEIASASTRIGIDIPMAQISIDNLAIASSALDAASGLAQGALGVATLGLGGNIGGFMDAAKAGINMVAAQTPQVRVSGSMGSLAEYQQKTRPLLTAQFFYLAEEAPATMGYPLCQNKTINSLSGYIKCGNVELDIPGTEPEQNEVVSLMQEGFEYE